MTDVEVKWLLYARRLLTAGPELCQCSSLVRMPRWPGFLGEKYHEGRVLLVGSVHFTSKLFTPEIKALIPIATDWAAGGNVTDEDYLRATRMAYSASFSQWSGQVWDRFAKIVKALGLDWQHVSFTNLAKCHMPEDDDEIIASCCRRFSINAHVIRLDPLATFIAKDSAKVNAVTTLGYARRDDRIVRRYHNRNGKSGAINCEGPNGWLGIDSVRYRAMRRRD